MLLKTPDEVFFQLDMCFVVPDLLSKGVYKHHVFLLRAEIVPYEKNSLRVFFF